MVALSTDSIIGHLLMEIAKPQKEGKFHELSASDLQIRMAYMGVLVHDSIVNIWKTTNEKIKDRLEELKAKKEVP